MGMIKEVKEQELVCLEIRLRRNMVEAEPKRAPAPTNAKLLALPPIFLFYFFLCLPTKDLELARVLGHWFGVLLAGGFYKYGFA